MSTLAHWWHCHGNKTTAFAIVSRSAKFIINSARAAARCQTERERRANLSPGLGAEETDGLTEEPGERGAVEKNIWITYQETPAESR